MDFELKLASLAHSRVISDMHRVHDLHVYKKGNSRNTDWQLLHTLLLSVLITITSCALMNICFIASQLKLFTSVLNSIDKLTKSLKLIELQVAIGTDTWSQQNNTPITELKGRFNG